MQTTLESAIAESERMDWKRITWNIMQNTMQDIELKASMEITDNEKKNVVEITESYEIDNIWTRNEDNNHQYVNFYGDLIGQ